MNLSTINRTRTSARSGAVASATVHPHRAVAPIEPVEFTEPEHLDAVEERHPRADRSAENMRVLRTPFTPSSTDGRAAA
ncbi:hypothetical protein ACL03H_13620 [Saccharopolyspora sp. MS10]|uniref:hypothetical protein n=1 Tax=Saccharopolyspora sp. MS10 TaxID=3385973 RepID=UPI00399FB14C